MAEQILKLRDLIATYGGSRSSYYAAAAEGRFPKPIKLFPGGQSSGWLKSEVDAHFAQRAEARDGEAHGVV